MTHNELADEPENCCQEDGELTSADDGRYEPPRSRTENLAEVRPELTVGVVQHRIHESDDQKCQEEPDRGDLRSQVRPLMRLRHHERWSRR